MIFLKLDILGKCTVHRNMYLQISFGYLDFTVILIDHSRLLRGKTLIIYYSIKRVLKLEKGGMHMAR